MGGKMNQKTLWETTLDPEARLCFQGQGCRYGRADEAVYQMLGDVVEPRREFIQQECI